jgi:Arc/MetJ family transcription regulator
LERNDNSKPSTFRHGILQFNEIAFAVEGLVAGHTRFCYTLTPMHRSCILMHMRTTLIIDDDLLQRAAKLTGVLEKTALVRMGLNALIARESARRLAELGGTDPKLTFSRSRRSIKS